MKKKKYSEYIFGPIIGVPILLLSIYFLLPNILEVYWQKVNGVILTIERESVPQNSKNLGTLERTVIFVSYSYVLNNKQYQGKDILTGIDRYPIGRSPQINDQVELIVDPNNLNTSMVRRPLNLAASFFVFFGLFFIVSPVMIFTLKKKG